MPFRLALTKGLPLLKVGKRSVDFFQSNVWFPHLNKIPLFTGQTRVHPACYVCSIPCLFTNASSFIGDSCLHPTPPPHSLISHGPETSGFSISWVSPIPSLRPWSALPKSWNSCPLTPLLAPSAPPDAWHLPAPQGPLPCFSCLRPGPLFSRPACSASPVEASLAVAHAALPYPLRTGIAGETGHPSKEGTAEQRHVCSRTRCSMPGSAPARKSEFRGGGRGRTRL